MPGAKICALTSETLVSYLLFHYWEEIPQPRELLEKIALNGELAYGFRGGVHYHQRE